MRSRSAVEVADERSKKRAQIVVAAVVVFVVGQILGGPLVTRAADSAHLPTRIVMWTANVIVLLLCLATGGGLLNDRQIRALVNDEVSRANYHTSIIAGFWVAMVSALGLYLIPSFENMTGRNALYVVVTLSVAVASLLFAVLELRAHRDA